MYSVNSRADGSGVSSARRRRAAATVALLTAGILPAMLAACGTAGHRPTTSAANADADPRASSRPRDLTPITLDVAGDVHFAGSSAAALDPGGLAAITPILSGADVSVVNLETAITERGTPADKQYTFRAPARGLSALKDAGVDVAGMANNHSLDFGAVGLRDTLAASRERHLPVIGIGLDADDAYRPWTTTVRGHRVAVLAATQVLDTSLVTAWTATGTHPGLASARPGAGADRLVAAVRSASASADSVVVLLHWGREMDPCPLPVSERLAARLVAAGADVVVGSHAHVQLGQGYLHAGGRTGFVDYGLGNFVFYAPSGAATDSGVLHLVLGPQGGVSSADWQPAKLGTGVPRPLTGPDAEAARDRKASLRQCTDLAATPSGTGSTR